MRFKAAVVERDAALLQVIYLIQDEALSLSGDYWRLGEGTVKQMLVSFEPEMVLDAVRIVAPKVAGRMFPDNSARVRYTWGVLRRLSGESE